MKVEALIFNLIAAFCVIAAVVYGLWAREPIGTTALVLSGGLTGLIGGFFLMRYVSITPRVDAWLRAIPIALIGAILGPVAVNGGPPEWLGLVAAVGLMYFANEFVATIMACAVVAVTRALS